MIERGITRRRALAGGFTIGLGAVGALAMGRRSGALAQGATPASSAGTGGSPVGTRWRLVAITGADGTSTKPENPANYTLLLGGDGRAAIQADCNRAFGAFVLAGEALSFGPLGMTRAMCPPGSVSDPYVAALQETQSFTLADGRLTLTQTDGGTLTFLPALGNVTWEWQGATPATGAPVVAADPARYTLIFGDKNQLRVAADCNAGFGEYTVDGSKLTLGPIATTLMACGDDSQDQAFLVGLNTVIGYAVEGDRLTLTLGDGGAMSFAVALETDEAATPIATPAG